MSKKILIIGANSQIGSFLFEYLQSSYVEVYGTTRRKDLISQTNKYIYLDLLSNVNLKKIRNIDIAIFCAGITGVKFCEKNKYLSNLVNVTYTTQLINNLLNLNIRVLFLSSNKVFNGSKAFYKYNDMLSPNTTYGLQKAMVENSITDSNFYTLRLTKVLTKENSMIQEWQKCVNAEKKIRLSNNSFISPISLKDVGDAVNLIIQTEMQDNVELGNIFQLGGREELSMFHFAQEYFTNNSQAQKLLVEKVNWKFQKNVYNSLETYLPN